MLGSYNVNGAPCELLIDQDALSWWPRAATKGTGISNNIANATETSSKSSQLSSPIKHLKRLSNKQDAASDVFEERKRRKIDFDQIIGLVKIAQAKRRGGPKKRSPVSERKPATDCDDASTIDRNDSETGEMESRVESSRSPGRCVKLKVYYAKKSEGKSTGRLIKLKKVTIDALARVTSSHHRTQNRNLSASSSSSSSYSSSSDNSDLSEHSGQLDGLCNLIEQHLELKRRQRPRRLLVFVNPFGGKGKALHLYKSRVRKILDLAQVECQLVVTKYANHARDTIEDPLFDLNKFDGIICIGGDGMFAELMNGLLFRVNRDKLLSSELRLINKRLSDRLSAGQDDATCGTGQRQDSDRVQPNGVDGGQTTVRTADRTQLRHQLKHWRSLLGGIGEQFQSPNIPIGVIGAGSTDANLFGFIGTNDTVSATLNIILGNQIQIDVSSIHSLEDDRLLRFVSTFVAYGYFGDVIRESEKFRWLGPSRYDLTALNSLIKYRSYNGLVRILRSKCDGTPLDLDRCHLNCDLCGQAKTINNNHFNSTINLNDSVPTIDCDIGASKEELDVSAGAPEHLARGDRSDEFEIIEEEGSFMGVNAAVTACRCPQTRKGFSPGNHLANGCADLILVRSCTRIQYINYLIRTGFTSKSAFDLGYVDAYRCRQFEFVVQRQKNQHNDDNQYNNHTTDDSATSDYQSKGSTKLSTNDTSIASSRQSSNANSLNSKHFVDDGRAESHDQRLAGSNRQLAGAKATYAVDGGESIRCSRRNELCIEDGRSSWNADGEILREQSIRVKVNNKLLRVFGTGEPQPRLRRRKKQA